MERTNRPEKRERIVAVKLIVGLLYPTDEPGLKTWATEQMSEAMGEVERTSADYVWGYTDYYGEISRDLTRCFFSLTGLRHPMSLPDWKRLAISLEASTAKPESGRRVNIDPGYADGARVVLASTKDNAQRVYLRDGIYAEVTMCRRKTGWEKFFYTFPDFKGGAYDDFFDLVRLDWRRDVREYRERIGLLDR